MNRLFTRTSSVQILAVITVASCVPSPQVSERPSERGDSAESCVQVVRQIANLRLVEMGHCQWADDKIRCGPLPSSIVDAVERQEQSCRRGEASVSTIELECVLSASSLAAGFACLENQTQPAPRIVSSPADEKPRIASSPDDEKLVTSPPVGLTSDAAVKWCDSLRSKNGACIGELVTCYAAVQERLPKYDKLEDHVAEELSRLRKQESTDAEAGWRARVKSDIAEWGVSSHELLSNCFNRAKQNYGGKTLHSAELVNRCLAAGTDMLYERAWYSDALDEAIAAVLESPASRNRCGGPQGPAIASFVFQPFADVVRGMASATASLSVDDPEGSIGRLDAAISNAKRLDFIGTDSFSRTHEKGENLPRLQKAKIALIDRALEVRRTMLEHFAARATTAASWRDAARKSGQERPEVRSWICHRMVTVNDEIAPQDLADCYRVLRIWDDYRTKTGGEDVFRHVRDAARIVGGDLEIPTKRSTTRSRTLFELRRALVLLERDLAAVGRGGSAPNWESNRRLLENLPIDERSRNLSSIRDALLAKYDAWHEANSDGAKYRAAQAEKDERRRLAEASRPKCKVPLRAAVNYFEFHGEIELPGHPIATKVQWRDNGELLNGKCTRCVMYAIVQAPIPIEKQHALVAAERVVRRTTSAKGSSFGVSKFEYFCGHDRLHYVKFLMAKLN